MSKGNKPFYIKDCALSAIATGVRSQVLSDFRDSIAQIHPSSIYFHFWVGRLRPEYPQEPFHNDFARWASKYLHDEPLAERLDIIDPTRFSSIQDLRDQIVDVIDERLEEREFIPWTTRDESFQFVRAILVIFDTPAKLVQPSDLVEQLESMGENSLFYHFIDARRRTSKGYDDFSEWMEGFNGEYQELIDQFRALNPYFVSMEELRLTLIDICQKFFAARVGS